MDLGHMLTAMVTPFDRRGNLDLPRVSELVEYLINHGTDGLVVAGTTGESPTLSSEEKIALFTRVVEAVNGRIPVIAGTGSNNTKASIELSHKAQEAGVDALLMVAPYYNKPSQEGLYQHFTAIAEQTSLPVVLYNVPGRTSSNITADTTIRLSKVENIIGIKEASKQLDQISEIIEETPEDFLVYSGDDGFTLPVMALGGNGVVSVSGHIVGDEMSDMIHSYLSGDVQRAATLHRRLLPLMKEMFAAPSPTPVKTALQLNGFDVGGVRLPLIPLTETERLSLQRLLKIT